MELNQFKWITSKDYPTPQAINMLDGTFYKYYDNTDNKFINSICDWAKRANLEKYCLLFKELPTTELILNDELINIVEYETFLPALNQILDEINRDRNRRYQEKFEEWIKLGEKMRQELGFPYPEYLGFADDYKKQILDDERFAREYFGR